jgi:hypothetical protein
MTRQTVHVFVFDTLSDWEPGYAVAGINDPAYQAHPGQYQVQTVSVTKDPVTTMGGVTIQPNMTLADLRPTESALLILGRWNGLG